MGEGRAILCLLMLKSAFLLKFFKLFFYDREELSTAEYKFINKFIYSAK